MPRAVIVVGNGLRHRQAATQSTLLYFQSDLGIETTLIEAAYLSPKELETKLCAALLRESQDPIVIHYSGHGAIEGWSFNDSDIFSYNERLAPLLKKCVAPVLLINDCCHSFAAAVAFEKHNCVLTAVIHF